MFGSWAVYSTSLTLVLFRSRNGYERSVRQIVRSLPGKQIYVPLYKSLPRSSFFSLPRKKSLVLGRIIISSLVPISLSKHAPNYLLYPKIKHYWLVSFGKAVHNVIFLSVFLFFHQSFIDHAVFVRLSSVHKHCWYVRLCIHPGGVSHEHAWYRLGRMFRSSEDRLYDNSFCCHGEFILNENKHQ